MQIIPAIDIIEGKCVRLVQGDYLKKTIYHEDPLDAALQFEDIGIKRLHLVDLDGAKKGEIVNYKTLEKIANKTKLIIDFGGGIKKDEDIKQVFDYGATIATVGSVAVKNNPLFLSWVEKYGADKILLGVDAKNEKIAINGWLEETQISIFDFIDENYSKNVKNIFCTDIAKDGLLQGPSIDLYKKIIANFKEINLIASGGVSCLKDLENLQEIGCFGTIVGKAIYENKISLFELKNFIKNAN